MAKGPIFASATVVGGEPLRRDIERRTFIAGTANALTVGLAGCAVTGSDDDGSDGNESEPDGGDADGNETTPPEELPVDATVANDSFEDGLTGWTVGEDLPPEPGEDSGTVDHGVETVSERAADGESAVQFHVSGVDDDGTVWVEQPIDFSTVDVIEFDGYSHQESCNEMAQVAFFAGEKPEGGLAEANFDRSEQTEDHEGWKTYTYDAGGTATLAVGVNVV